MSTSSESTSTALPAGSGEPDLMGRVVQSAHATIDRIAEQAAPNVQSVLDSVNEANELLHEHADYAVEMGEEWAHLLRSTVREHPLASVVAAAALGMVVARILR